VKTVKSIAFFNVQGEHVRVLYRINVIDFLRNRRCAPNISL